jgi:hypothetical protein
MFVIGKGTRSDMRCYYHNDREAIGTCRLCSKGLCPECAADLDVAIGCKGRHEGLARRIALSQVKASRVASILPVFLIGMGIIWVGWGLLGRPISVFMVICGVGLAAFGFLFWRKVSASSGK